MNRDEKDLTEIAVAGFGAWVVFRVVKWVIGWVFVAAIAYFGVHYLVGWHLVLPVLGRLFDAVHGALVRLFSSIQ